MNCIDSFIKIMPKHQSVKREREKVIEVKLWAIVYLLELPKVLSVGFVLSVIITLILMH